MNIPRQYAVAAFLGALTIGVFLQSAQGSLAYTPSEEMCEQLDRACTLQQQGGTAVRSRACSMYGAVCAFRYGSAPSVSSDERECGPNNVRCRDGTQPTCSDGYWGCVQTRSSSSSSYEPGASCGPNPVLCSIGTYPQCSNGQWNCISMGDNGTSSSCDLTQILCIEGFQAECRGGRNVCVPGDDGADDGQWATCPDGYRYRVRDENGNTIYYFADPCLNHYGSSSSSSSSSPSSQGEGCFCTQQYDPVCGADGKTYGNNCEAGCANVSVSSQGECSDLKGAASTSGSSDCSKQAWLYCGNGTVTKCVDGQRQCVVATGPGSGYSSSSSHSSASSGGCTGFNICASGYASQCVSGEWKCTPPASSSACSGFNICAPGYMDQCINGERKCMPSSSSSVECSGFNICAPGYTNQCVNGSNTCVQNASSSSANNCSNAGWVFCTSGTVTKCVNGQYQCVSLASSAPACSGWIVCAAGANSACVSGQLKCIAY